MDDGVRVRGQVSRCVILPAYLQSSMPSSCFALQDQAYMLHSIGIRPSYPLLVLPPSRIIRRIFSWNGWLRCLIVAVSLVIWARQVSTGSADCVTLHERRASCQHPQEFPYTSKHPRSVEKPQEVERITWAPLSHHSEEVRSKVARRLDFSSREWPRSLNTVMASQSLGIPYLGTPHEVFFGSSYYCVITADYQKAYT